MIFPVAPKTGATGQGGGAPETEAESPASLPDLPVKFNEN
jgi:hypothetical protein